MRTSRQNNLALYSALLIVALCFSATLSSAFAVPQSSNQGKRRLKDFGSSLKRLKWDPKKSVAIDTPRQKVVAKNSDEDEVLRIETSLVVCDVLVTDRQGRLVRGLTESDFIVKEDDKLQESARFRSVIMQRYRDL